ncbi:hypothetical protein [Acinetobacter gyllenbergii]|uniref:hypothetical protein n=1 Tax=Acinetobacter gyllenbergii TaxID=134534 RepID=UPI003F55AD46
MSDFKDFSRKVTKDQSPLLQANEHTQVNTPNAPQPTPKPEESSKPEDSQEPDPNNK